MPHFHHFSICNQNQSVSILVIFRQNTKVIALLFGQKCLIPSIFNLQSKSINFNFGHFSAKYQGYSLTFWPKMPHFHHFSICNQNQSVSILVIFRQNTKVIALLFWPKMPHFHHFSICNQNQSISILVIFRQNTKVIALLFGQKMPHFHHFSISNQNQSISILVIFSAKYQGYSLTFWPKMPHFHHFSICNQNQSISILVIFRQNTKVIALLFGQNASFSSLFNPQSKSINFNFGHFFGKIPRL